MSSSSSSATTAEERGRCLRCAPDRPKVVFDRAAGDTICTGCGLVLDERAIDWEDDRRRRRANAEDVYSSSSSRASSSGGGKEGGGGTGASSSVVPQRFLLDKTSARSLVTMSIGGGGGAGGGGGDQNDQDYYSDALRLMGSYFKDRYPDSRDRNLEARAFEIFDCLFRKQREEKQAVGRMRYSAKWPLLVASIYVAHRESGKCVPVAAIVLRDTDFVQPSEATVLRVLQTIRWDPAEHDQRLREKARRNKRAMAESKRTFLLRRIPAARRLL